MDKSVADASEQRKAEHADYMELISNDAAAKEILAWAKNRLNKFYNKALYKPAPKRELSEEESIATSMGGAAFVGIYDHSRYAAAPPPPPETFKGYSKKTEESAGVTAMIDLLIKDLDKEMTEAEVTEKESQKEYEKLMADAAKKRTDDAKAITTKMSNKASEEEALQAQKDSKAEAGKQLMATGRFVKSLHSECDWLLKYFDVRKSARASEVEALGQAKAVLKGADFSLIQTSSLANANSFLAPY